MRDSGALLAGPKLPLRDALRYKHFHAGNGGQAFAGSEFQSCVMCGRLMRSMTTRQFSSRAESGDILSLGCMPIGVALRMASNVSDFKARRGTTSPLRLSLIRELRVRDEHRFPTWAPALASANGGRSRHAPAAEDQDAASLQTKFFLESAQNPDVVRIAANKRAIAAHDDGVDGANFGRERLAFLQMLQDGLFVWNGHAEAANPELRHRFQKIAKILYKKGQIDGVEFAGYECGVVYQRRKGVPDRIADHAVDASAPGQLVGAVKVLQVVEGHLAGSRGCSDGGVRQLAAFSQGENASGQADFAHRHSDQLGEATRQPQEPDAIAESLCMGSDFDGVGFEMRDESN